jgi:hypothetical protein
MGSGDIQSLADMANSYEVVRGIAARPCRRGAAQTCGRDGGTGRALALTMMPMEELLKKLLGILF